MAAGAALESGHAVTPRSTVGLPGKKKILVTGKGRCNPDQQLRRGDLFGRMCAPTPAFSTRRCSLSAYCGPWSCLSGGRAAQDRTGPRVFPVSDRAEDARAAFALRGRRAV